MKTVEAMKEYKATPNGTLFNAQLNRPTKKYNRKVGTYHVGLRIFDEQQAMELVNAMKEVQNQYTIENNLQADYMLPLPFYDTRKMGINKGFEFNPFRMNSCGWSGRINNVYVNIPKVFNVDSKELNNASLSNLDDSYGKVFYSIEGYNNQEGVGIILRLRGVQLFDYTPQNQIAS